MQRQGDEPAVDRRSGARDGFGIAGVILCLVIGTGVVLLLMGLWKRFARETIPTLVELPAGSWALGAVLGVITVLGVIGGVRCAAGSPAGPRWRTGCGRRERQHVGLRPSGRSSIC
ncbi:hypothetical protein ABTX62_15125 [Streptomyces sp. NPDC096046]|uniref:hypothetical protein n=1 Tax=Streptomyces sp. NPDC096046 TaxID=3155542 RepID=UPI003325A789